MDNIVIPKPYTDLLTHLLNLIKLTFLPNLNRSNLSVHKQSVCMLIAWLRCVCDALLAKVTSNEFCFSLLSLLAIVNSNLALACKHSNVNSINYLYFMQNDIKFCREYLRFVKTLTVPLIENSLSGKRSNFDNYLGKNKICFYFHVKISSRFLLK